MRGGLNSLSKTGIFGTKNFEAENVFSGGGSPPTVSPAAPAAPAAPATPATPAAVPVVPVIPDRTVVGVVIPVFLRTSVFDFFCS